MRTNARRVRFPFARADRGVQKSKGKGKQMPKDVKGGRRKKRKRSEDSSIEDSESSDFSGSSIHVTQAVTTINRLLICFKNF